jgi:hypothetical protein
MLGAFSERTVDATAFRGCCNLPCACLTSIGSLPLSRIAGGRSSACSCAVCQRANCAECTAPYNLRRELLSPTQARPRLDQGPISWPSHLPVSLCGEGWADVVLARSEALLRHNSMRRAPIAAGPPHSEWSSLSSLGSFYESLLAFFARDHATFCEAPMAAPRW